MANRFKRNAARLLAATAVAVLIAGCNTLPVSPAPTLGERLDRLYETDRNAWSREMAQRVQGQATEVPMRHLALAIEHFNSQGQRGLFLESVWRYLRVRSAQGPQLASAADRHLLESYAEYALRSPDAAQHKRLKTLCLSLEDEAVCQAG